VQSKGQVWGSRVKDGTEVAENRLEVAGVETQDGHRVGSPLEVIAKLLEMRGSKEEAY